MLIYYFYFIRRNIFSKLKLTAKYISPGILSVNLQHNNHAEIPRENIPIHIANMTITAIKIINVLLYSFESEMLHILLYMPDIIGQHNFHNDLFSLVHNTVILINNRFRRQS